jgi:hypothetical protein
VGLVQLVKFLVVELIHSCLNYKFDMSVAFTANYFLVGDDIFINNETILMTDFMNLKIKLIQSFRCTHKDKVCMRVFIEVNAHTCMSICICTVFLKKNFRKKRRGPQGRWPSPHRGSASEWWTHGPGVPPCHRR